MNSSKFGWADDIVAPRQEINTLSLLYEEEAIQERLRAGLKPKEFLAAYREAREAYRMSTPPTAAGSERTVELTQKVALFGAKASANARRESRQRGMLRCVGPDRPGVLASLTELIATHGGNIEGAAMSFVAGHLVTVLCVSGVERMEGNPRIEGIPNLTMSYVEMESADVDWPRPQSTWWHLCARGRPDASLLLGLCGALASRSFPLIALSSWREAELGSGGGEAEVVDLNFAVAPVPAGDDLQAVRELEEEIDQELAGAQVDVLSARWPTEHHSEGEVGEAGPRDVVMTVVGHAKPGFVHTVLTTLVEDVDGVLDIRGSAMAMLEGMTVLTVVFRRAEAIALADVAGQVEKRVTQALRTGKRMAPAIPIQFAEAEPAGGGEEATASDIRSPTHELTLRVPEQPRVVAKVARSLADHGVNITWFVTHVREPAVGERFPICDIHMYLHVEPDKEDAVAAEVHALAKREGWEAVRLAKWSFRR